MEINLLRLPAGLVSKASTGRHRGSHEAFEGVRWREKP